MNVEVETPLDFRSFDRATRSLARRESSIHSSIHASHPFIHSCVARSCADALEGGHRRVMIGDSSKPYVSRMTTVVDIRNSDIDRFHRSHRSFSSIISIVFIDHIDRFHRSHRSHRSHRFHPQVPPPPRLAVVVAPWRVVAFVRDALESAARVRIGERGRDRRSSRASVVRPSLVSSRVASRLHRAGLAAT